MATKTPGYGLYLVVKSLLIILPVIVTLVEAGRIKTAAYDELMAAFSAKWAARIKAAQDAGKEADGDESSDPNNRSR